MSQLPHSALVTLARNAGFPESEITQAVAVALAASGGRTDYAWTDPHAGGTTWAGLWGTPVGVFPWADLAATHAPQTSAMIARDLWQTHPQGWAWSAPARSPHFPAALAHARHAVSLGAGPVVAAQPRPRAHSDLPAFIPPDTSGRIRHAGRLFGRTLSR